ncbi:MAG: hypothetical protein ACK4Z6_02210, partial [Candidatus Methylomirabilales bacterium]
EGMVKALLANPSLPPSALVVLAQEVSHPPIIELLIQDPLFRLNSEAVKALHQNPSLTPELERQLIAATSPLRREEERKKSLLQMIKELTMGQKIALARKGNKEVRMILIKDPNELVALEVVMSPKITEAEILNIAQMRDVSEKVLRAIANDRRYRSNKQIVMSLLHNPKTPVGVSLGLGLTSLTDKELEGLAKSRNIPGALARAARAILDRRKKPPAEGH